MSQGMSALELATTKELLDELESRSTALVVAIRQHAEVPGEFVTSFKFFGDARTCWWLSARITQQILDDVAPREVQG